MASSGSQASFRHILLSRLLLLSVPVLLLGIYVTSRVTYRKARSALLETARQNLTESAVRKGQALTQTLALLRANLATMSASRRWVEVAAPPDVALLRQLQLQLPRQFDCLQLRSPATRALLASTCREPLPAARLSAWPPAAPAVLKPADVRVRIFRSELNAKVAAEAMAASKVSPSAERDLERGIRLDFVLSAPIYAGDDQLRYILEARATVRDRSQPRPGSLAGYPVLIDEAGTILVHPLPERIGRNITQENDAQRLQSLLRNAIAGQQNFLHLFSFDKNGGELLAGYTAIDSPVSAELGQKWAVLAIADLDSALADLEAIRRVLLGLLAALTLALLAANAAAIFYISREMARPLEKLRDYALNQDNVYSNDAMPRNFRIREFNQLGLALEQMLQRLRTWTEELERAWQEAKIANQLKDEFLTITSHELRTPLNGILGSLSIVQDDLCDSRAEELDYIQQAQQAALQLYGIINDISDITKLRAGQLNVSVESVNLYQCLQAAIASCETARSNKDLSLDWTEPSPEIWVYADLEQLQRIFTIVLDNAIKFTPAGSIAIAVRIEAAAAVPSGQSALVTIRDTGIGVAPELQAKLFKPFAVVDGSHTRQYGGVGLGLAIARNLIELMHGRIQLTSDGPDCGTTVTIGLPVARQVTLRSSVAQSS